jgi:RNA ligase (TIGR02306 family)
MAFFGVTIEKIKTAEKHPNADRLDVCTLEGMSFQFVTGRDEFKPGDTVLYFPIDSCLPLDLMKKLNLVRQKKENGELIFDEKGNPVIEGTLSSSKKNRLKTVKLRGLLSQGLVSSMNLIDDLLTKGGQITAERITEFLGVTKYEPPEIECNDAILVRPPVEFKIYDIEGADRYQEIAEALMNDNVLVTEKLEGQNFSVLWKPATEEYFINSRNNSIIPIDGKKHSFHIVSDRLNLHESIKKTINFANINSSIILYGEFIGPKIQKGIYELKNYTVRFFDIMIDEKFLDVDEKIELFKNIGLGELLVPILSKGKTLKEFLNGKTIKEASNGKSVLNSNVLREGIVITPMKEKYDPQIGRLILKQRDPIYLGKEKD